MKQTKRIIALLLAMSLIVGLLSIPVLAEEPTEELLDILEISTPEAFLEFSQMCRYDAYSDGLSVRLTGNIDVSGLPFEDIPIFLGSFDGGGYTISGIESDVERDTQGLFRRIAEGASVSGLTVLATVKTEHTTIGGIAAENYGTIQNCEFRGVVSGMDTIGGIAGANYGSVINCSVSGGIFGESQVGGIVGVNEGSILRCYNYAEINTNISDFEFTVEDTLVSNINPNSDTIDIADIGGIAGSSDGIIQSCTNRGAVGYPHVGYNIGGIVGIQSGYVSSCTNIGLVQGRKEVGGIVGQFEPYVDTIYSLSKLQELRDELDIFSDLTSLMADNSKGSNDLISNQFDTLGDSIDQSKTQTEELMDQIETMVDANIDTVNEISVTVADTLDALSPIVDSLDPVIDNLSLAMEDFQGMADDLGDMMEELENVGDVAEDVLDDLDTAQSNLESSLSIIQSALSVLNTIEPNLESVTAAVQSMVFYLQQGVGRLEDAQDSLGDAIGQMRDLGDVLGDAGDELQDALTQMENAFGNLSDAMDDLGDTNDLVSDLVDDLSQRDEIIFTKLEDDYDDARDALSDSLEVVGDNLSDLNSIANASGDLLIDDMDAVTQQMTDILDLVLEMMQDVTSFVEDEEYKIEDISIMDTSDIYAGKITDCENTGPIEGDINVGGIAGAVSFELSFDMEDDWKTDRDKTQSITRQGIAIIENALNTGDVTAKKDGAGGIVGYQSFGLVQNCTANAIVESTEGDYVGGIVGQSNGYIRSSYAKTTLSGSQFVGGISGASYDVQGCYSLSAVTATQGGFGGIVGDLDSDGTLKNNYFVSDTLGGLDGISFKGMAESISYEDLLLVEGLPEVFQSMTLRFYVEDILIDTLYVDFGASVSPEEFPVMAEKDGYYSRWEVVDTTAVTSDLKLEGDYYLLLPLLGGAKNEAGINTILVDGIFTDRDILMIEQSEMDYTIWVDGENTAITAIRYLAPEGDVTIELLTDEGWVMAEFSVDGKYLIVPIDTNGTVQFRVTTIDTAQNWQWMVVVALGVVAIAGIWMSVHKKKKVVGCSAITATEDP